MARPREALMFRPGPGRSAPWFLHTTEALVAHYRRKENGGWFLLAPDLRSHDVEEVRQTEETRWAPEVRRRTRWRIRKQRRRYEGSGE